MHVFKKAFCKTGGRNVKGVITIRHRGGGSKKTYKKPFLFYNHSSFAILSSCIFDRFRSARFVFVESSKGFRSFFYIVEGFEVGIRVVTSYFRKPLSSFLLGDLVNNLFRNHSSSQSYFVKAAGCCAQIIARTAFYTILKIPSGFLRSFQNWFFGCEGRVFFPILSVKVKAGQARNAGFRPTVRGVAINPVDHPHGGGEGKSTPGRPSVSPWGLLAKCKKK